MNWLRKFLAIVAMGLFALGAHAGERELIQGDMKAQRWGEAEARLNGVVERHPDNATAFYWRAQVRAKQGNLEGARADLTEARRLDPAEGFATRRAVLSDLERRVGAAQQAPILTLQGPRIEQTVQPGQADGMAPVTRKRRDLAEIPASAVEKATWIALAAGGTLGIIVVGMITTGWLASRKEAREEEARRVESWKSRLSLAKADLEDAMAACDARSDAPEVKFAAHDACNRVRARVLAVLTELNSDDPKRRRLVKPDHELLISAKTASRTARGVPSPFEEIERRTHERRVQGSKARRQELSELRSRGRGFDSGDLAMGIAGAGMMAALMPSSSRAVPAPQSSGIDFGGIDSWSSSSSASVDVGSTSGSWD